MPIRALRVYRWTEAYVRTGSTVLERVDRGSERSKAYDEKEVDRVAEFLGVACISPHTRLEERRKRYIAWELFMSRQISSAAAAGGVILLPGTV